MRVAELQNQHITRALIIAFLYTAQGVQSCALNSHQAFLININGEP